MSGHRDTKPAPRTFPASSDAAPNVTGSIAITHVGGVPLGSPVGSTELHVSGAPAEDATTPTDEQIAEWERLASEACPGPWEADESDAGRMHVYCRAYEDETPVVCGPPRGNAWDLEAQDAHFIAAARVAVPALVAEVRRLRASRPSSEPGGRAPSPGAGEEGLRARVEALASSWLEAADLRQTMGIEARVEYERGRQFGYAQALANAASEVRTALSGRADATKGGN